jgi:hypothetical protein
MPLPSCKRYDREEMFANGTSFDVVVTDRLDVDEVRFDMLDPEDYWVWAPRLGPSAMAMYVDILRYWPHRGNKLSITLDLERIAHDIGINIDTAQRTWMRMHQFHLIDAQPAFSVVEIPQFLPILGDGQLRRMSSDWLHWYDLITKVRAVGQGLS